MTGKQVRCPECGATALNSVSPGFRLENPHGCSNTFFFLACDGVARHNFAFSAEEQRSMSQEEGRIAQDEIALKERARSDN